MATPPPPGPFQPGQNPYGAGTGGNPYAQNPYAQQPYGQPPAGAPPQPGTGENPFAQQSWGRQPQYGAPDAHMGGANSCSLCGGYPAVSATVRGHQGFVIIMRFLKRRGNFCRTCGIATHREMTAKTLWQGWWGILSIIITPITVLYNLRARSKFNKLPAPTGSFRPPLDPGKPIFGRAGAFVALVPLIVVALIVVGIANDDSASSATAGDCVSKSGTDSDPTVKVVDCTSPNAAYTVIKKVSGEHNGDACDNTLYDEYDESGAGDDFALCLTPVK